MKVTFVGLGMEQLGVSQLSAIAKQHGHQTSLAYSASLFHDRFNIEIPSLAKHFDDTDSVLKTIEQQQPDVLAFSALTSTYQWMLEVARRSKEMNPNIKTVFGGVHVSAVPDRVIAKSEVDFAVAGEGDVAFPAILKAIETNQLSSAIVNTRFKTTEGKIVRGIQGGFIQELDALPYYDKPLWEEVIRMGDLYLTMASRGCPYRCIFCFNNFFAKLPEEKSGKYVHIRSVEHMLGELKIAKSRYQIKVVDFLDDVFTTDKKWLHEFLPLYKKEINLPYQIQTHPRYLDEEVAKLLKETGCTWIQMGVQSLDETFKKDSLMRYEKSDHVSRALQLMHQYGLMAKVDHMFGLPDEPIAAQETARQLYATHYPKRIQTYWTCYLPGTDMMNQAIAKGSLSAMQAEKINEGEDFFFFRNTDNIKEPELVETYKAYEVIFRILPVVPELWRTKLLPRHARFIPLFLVKPLSVLADLIAGVSLGNPEFSAYALHNLFHLRRFISLRLNWKLPSATTVKRGSQNFEKLPDITIVSNSGKVVELAA